MLTDAGIQEFERAAEAILPSISGMSDDSINIALAKAVALIGDSHTTVSLPAEIRAVTPIAFRYYPDGIRAIVVPEDRLPLLGARLVEVNGTNVSDIFASLSKIRAFDNYYGAVVYLPLYVRMPMLLQLVGHGVDSTTAMYRLELRDGSRRQLQFSSIPDSIPSGYESVFAQSSRERLAFSQRGNYWWRYLEDRDLFYIQYNACVEDPSYRFSEFCTEVDSVMTARAMGRIVVDLRRNGGGSAALAMPLIRQIESKCQDHDTKTYVLVGRETYSAGVLNAVAFVRAMRAVTVGEPTGTRPNHFGEQCSFTLPNSGILIQCSTRRFEIVPGDASALFPDWHIEQTLEDDLLGSDRALEACWASTSDSLLMVFRWRNGDEE